MSFKKHGRGYFEPRTLYQIDSLYAWKHGLYFPPVIVEINATSSCNQKCRYCYVAGRTSGKLPDDVLTNLMPRLSDAGVRAIVFQGAGEPLSHKALPDAIELGGKHNLSISLTTNGTLLSRSVQERILPYLSYIKLSALESNPERYAYYHGCSEKQWHMLVDNIKTAVSLREKHDLQILYLATVYLAKENFHEAHAIVKFCKELGIDYVSIQEAVYNEYSYSGPLELASNLFSETEVSEMKDKVLTLKDDNFFIKIRFPLNDGSFTNGRFKDCWIDNWCQGVKFNTLVNADGEVYPCFRYWGMKEFSYGNICEKSFEEIWKGEKKVKIIEYTNTTPPKGDECSTCNVTKINEILSRLQNTADNKWKDFLI